MQTKNVTPKIWFLVIQATPFCNIDCSYCYLPNRADKSTISFETLERLFASVFESGFASKSMTVLWHAGEPLLLKPEFYERAFELIAGLTPPGTTVRQSINTNGMLIDERWCNFFKAQKVMLGVSIDGPKEIHDSNRVTRAGVGTFDQTIAGMRMLRANGVPFYVISVLTNASLSKPRELFDFYVAEGVKHVCFNVEEREGVNTKRPMVGPDEEMAYDAFLRSFWQLVTAAGHPITVREFEGMLRELTWRPGVTRPRTLVEPFGHLNVDVRGNIYTFAPELMGMKSAQYSDFIIGNVMRHSLSECLASESLRKQLVDIQEGVQLCRSSCDYFEVCGGGSPANKFSENGAFATTETMFCRMSKKVVANVVLDAFESASAADTAAELQVDLPY